MGEYVICNKCGITYQDTESIGLVRYWLTTPSKYAPCPEIGCDGQMELKVEEIIS